VNHVDVDLADLEVGMDVTAHWPNGCGLGGVVVEVLPGKVILCSGTAKHINEVHTREISRWTVEVPFDADECTDYGDDCSGPVDYWWPGYGHRSWLRCEHHGEARLKRHENEPEYVRYAHSDVRPPNYEARYEEPWDDD
jgi:hypothetical protein